MRVDRMVLQLCRGCRALVHERRFQTFLAVTQAIADSRQLSVTALGRRIKGRTFPKHGIKRVDRALSNPRMQRECPVFFGALAQALIMRPKILLLDEPFGALDPGIRAEIHELMKKLWHETQLTVVMVTHDLREAFTLATRVVAFERPRDRPEERQRYGASLTRDIEIWPARIAGEPSPFSPDRDGPVLSTGFGRDDPAAVLGGKSPHEHQPG